MEKQFGFGANESPKDYRTIKSDAVMALPLTTGGYDYLPEDIEHQHKVGICTAISIVQMAQKVYKTKYSADFQYLLQKKFIDQNWNEGSSPLASLKVGNKYGFLPAEDWVYTSEADRELPYSQYIEKLKAIPDSEVNRLISLCENKLKGYEIIDSDIPEKVAAAIQNSEAGIITRYEVGQEWWTPSWKKEDINPLRAPAQSISGHQIIASLYRFNDKKLIRLSNTWGKDWCDQGEADTYYEDYKMTEAWLPHFKSAPEVIINRPSLPKHQPLTRNLSFMMTGDDVMRLQKVLGVKTTGFFWYATLNAVIAYQKKNKIDPAVGFVGPITREKLNKEFFS